MSAKVYHLQIPSVGLPYWPMVLKTDYDALAAELAKMIKARELSSEASATLRDESIAKNDRIRALESALRKLGYAAVEYIGKRGDGEAFADLVQAEHEARALLPSQLETPEAIHARIVTETADAMAAAPGFCHECLMTGGHKLRCSKAETSAEQASYLKTRDSRIAFDAGWKHRGIENQVTSSSEAGVKDED